MPGEGDDRRNDVFARMIEIGTPALREQLKVSEPAARVAMVEVAYEICKEFEGDSLYLSKDAEFRLHHRDEKIAEAYDAGKSTGNIAIEYEITPRQVMKIVVRRTQSEHLQRKAKGGIDG